MLEIARFEWKWKRKKRILSTFWSMVKLCINRDNPLVPLLSATWITVYQMRKCLKLSILVQFMSAKVLASKRFFDSPLSCCPAFSSTVGKGPKKAKVMTFSLQKLLCNEFSKNMSIGKLIGQKWGGICQNEFLSFLQHSLLTSFAKQALHSVMLYGPTNFSPVIDHVAR